MKKLTHEEFLEKLPKDREYEVIGEYKNMNTKIFIRDRYGLGFISPYKLIEGLKTINRQCVYDKTSYYTNKYKEQFKNLFSYQKFIYKGYDINSIITCPIHGDFEITPHMHSQGQSCKKCGYKRSSEKRKNTIQYFTNKANKKHLNIYNYSEFIYINNHTKLVIICPIHGKFKQTPAAHLNGQKCPPCSLLEKTETKIGFIEKAQKIHENTYKYSQVNYINTKTKIEIICKKHGSFYQTPNQHLSGKGCSICGYEQNGFRKQNFIINSKGKECTFYILKCWNENETFYKIGITKHNPKKRYCQKSSMPYNYEIIKEIKSFDAGWIFDLEIKNKRLLINFKYSSLIRFAGSKTECFSNVNILLEDIENGNI